jgi:RNA polymerase sigma-70 factor (ECF subfamily)
VRACLRRDRPGPVQILAAIAAVHTDAPSAPLTDWGQIVALYDQLLRFRPDGVVAVNRAAALAELAGPDAALVELGHLAEELDDYQPFHATRADLLARTGRIDDALSAYDRAIRLTDNEVEAAFLRRRRASIA